MSDQHHVHFFHVLFAVGTHRISHHPRVNKDGGAFGGPNAEGGVSEPSEFDSVQFHVSSYLLASCPLLGSCRPNILVTWRAAFNSAPVWRGPTPSVRCSLREPTEDPDYA